ncbi:Bacterial regulatory protein, LacI family [Nonomuraea coxensis DSM 45129]|uniref:Bacterial regulatory protein, LacI family n=1 Tax=Nonomuraea coxensis DSM 45129 TaxID=1122611 RepID=A0ABX8U5C9_9ACTN|nr:Bacterial regulatory protein, LacI family [Nonomuraea coxensis DSM 45129]
MSLIRFSGLSGRSGAREGAGGEEADDRRHRAAGRRVQGAVSYALNGRPGVSAGTRARILAIAQEVGWRPSLAARSLSGARAGAIGLVLCRPARAR